MEIYNQISKYLSNQQYAEVIERVGAVFNVEKVTPDVILSILKYSDIFMAVSGAFLEIYTDVNIAIQYEGVLLYFADIQIYVVISDYTLIEKFHALCKGMVPTVKQIITKNRRQKLVFTTDGLSYGKICDVMVKSNIQHTTSNTHRDIMEVVVDIYGTYHELQSVFDSIYKFLVAWDFSVAGCINRQSLAGHDDKQFIVCDVTLISNSQDWKSCLIHTPEGFITETTSSPPNCKPVTESPISGEKTNQHRSSIFIDLSDEELNVDTVTGRVKQPKRSKGEQIIAEVLTSFGIKFTEQKRFPDCKLLKPLPFDFFIPDYNICIEYDGIQHEKPVKFFGGETAYQQQQIKDSIKTKYCVDTGKKLVRIRHNLDREEITDVINSVIQSRQ